MQALVIKQAQGLWSIETSSGVRWAGASLQSALDKAGAGDSAEALGKLFLTIPDSGSGQSAFGHRWGVGPQSSVTSVVGSGN